MLQVQFKRMLLPPPENVCAGQLLHVALEMAAVAVLYLPCEHDVQAAEPLVSLKPPASHAVHSTPSGPV